jgi:hypothetical protein
VSSKIIPIFVVLLLCAASIGCKPSVDSHEAKILSFYQKNKHGDGADYGIFSKGIVVPGKYLVGTISGVYDDQTLCQEIVDYLNNEDPNMYFCDSLN